MTDVKTDMMRLWKDTFDDTDRYIRLVFDAYFDPSNVCVRYDGDRLIAALLGVPYRFRMSAREGTFFESPRVGMYLCGLATRPEYRRQGIMSEMMEEIQTRASLRGFDLTFLIPADSHLREYYRRRGYFDFSRRVDMRFSEEAMMKIAKGEWRPNFVASLTHAGDVSGIRELAAWCVSRELESGGPSMLHSAEDFVVAMAENENAIFFTAPASGQEYPILANLVAVAFPDDSVGSIDADTLRRNPQVVGGWSFRKIFIMPTEDGDPSHPDVVHIDVSPYAQARLLPGSRISQQEFHDVSVSLLLD